MNESRIRRLLKGTLSFYVPLLIVLVVLLFPFYWMIITSFKHQGELFNFSGNPLWVQNPSLGNYAYLFRNTLFEQWLVNITIVAGVTTLFALVVSIMASYALTRLRFPGAAVYGILIFVTYLVPRSSLFIPLAQTLKQLDILGDLSSLILTYPTFLIPFCTWLLSGYFRTIPIEPEECAMVDGCTRLGAVIRITLPLAVPGILTAGIFAFTLSWNELLYALVFVSGEMEKTLTLGLITNLANADYYSWGPLMAGATLASIPVALLYFYFMDLYVSGVTAGAVKG